MPFFLGLCVPGTWAPAGWANFLCGKGPWVRASQWGSGHPPGLEVFSGRKLPTRVAPAWASANQEHCALEDPRTRPVSCWTVGHREKLIVLTVYLSEWP